MPWAVSDDKQSVHVRQTAHPHAAMAVKHPSAMSYLMWKGNDSFEAVNIKCK